MELFICLSRGVVQWSVKVQEPSLYKAVISQELYGILWLWRKVSLWRKASIVTKK